MKYILTQEKYVFNKKLGIEPTNEIFGLFKKLFSKVSNAIKNVKGGEELNKAITDTKGQIDTLFTKQLQTKTNIKAQGNNQVAKPAAKTAAKTATQPATETTTEKITDNISLDYKINEADAPALDYSTLSIEELKQLEVLIDQQLKAITDKFNVIVNQIKKKFEGNVKTINASELAASTIQEYIFDKKYDMFAKSSDKNKIAEIQKKRAEAEKKVKDLTFKIKSEGNATTTLVPKEGQEYNYYSITNKKTIKVKIISVDATKKTSQVQNEESNKQFEVQNDKLIKIDGVNYEEAAPAPAAAQTAPAPEAAQAATGTEGEGAASTATEAEKKK